MNFITISLRSCLILIATVIIYLPTPGLATLSTHRFTLRDTWQFDKQNEAIETIRIRIRENPSLLETTHPLQWMPADDKVFKPASPFRLLLDETPIVPRRQTEIL